MKSIFIYEPAMCCPSGLCGVSADPELLRISVAFDKLNKGGIQAERYNLSNDPMQFIKNREINELVGNEGVDVLPITVADSRIILTMRYPTNEEIINLLSLPIGFFGDRK